MYKTWNVVDYIVVLNSNGNLQPWSYTDSCDSSWYIKIPRKRGTNWLKRNVQQEQGLSKGRARRPRQIQFSLRFQSKFNPGLHFFKSSHCLCYKLSKFNNTLQRRIIFFFRDFGMPQHTNSAGFLTLFKKPLNPRPAPPFEHCKKKLHYWYFGASLTWLSLVIQPMMHKIERAGISLRSLLNWPYRPHQVLSPHFIDERSRQSMSPTPT